MANSNNPIGRKDNTQRKTSILNEEVSLLWNKSMLRPYFFYTGVHAQCFREEKYINGQCNNYVTNLMLFV